MTKKLYKSNHNKMIDGVCGGVAEYLNIDPTLIRLLWVIFIFLGGSGILAYIVCAIIVPRDPGAVDTTYYTGGNHNGGNGNAN